MVCGRRATAQRWQAAILKGKFIQRARAIRKKSEKSTGSTTSAAPEAADATERLLRMIQPLAKKALAHPEGSASIEWCKEVLAELEVQGGASVIGLAPSSSHSRPPRAEGVIGLAPPLDDLHPSEWSEHHMWTEWPDTATEWTEHHMHVWMERSEPSPSPLYRTGSPGWSDRTGNKRRRFSARRYTSSRIAAVVS